MVKRTLIDKETTQGHVFFLYHNPQERIELLANYFRQGIDADELCIFVTPDSPQDAIKTFKAAGFDASSAFHEGALRIFEMEPTYLPEGRFVADFMLDNVRNFIRDAEAQGYSGLRTAGEMSWLMEHPDAAPEAHAYERAVNTLNTPAPSFVGLCLYPVQDTFDEVIKSAVHTHPSFIHDGHAQLNPYYEAA